MRNLTPATLGLVFALVMITAPMFAARSPGPQTNQERVSDPRLRNLRNLRGPGSSLGATVRNPDGRRTGRSEPSQRRLD